MQTQLLSASDSSIAYAAKLLKAGELVAIPTETVYGLACDATNPEAVAKIFIAKGRPQDNPLIVHVNSMEMLKPLVRELPQAALNLAQHYWPGPMTLVLPKSNVIPSIVSAGLDTVAIRMPSHPIALRIIEESGLPLAAPSANLSSRPSPTLASHVMDDMQGRIPLIIDAGASKYGLESTVISIQGETAHILRPGAVTYSQISELIDSVDIDNSVLKPFEGGTASSPGMKYKHYTPKATVIMVKGDIERFIEYTESKKNDNVYCLVFDADNEKISLPHLTFGDSPEEQANQLFSRLRELDKLGAQTIYARCPTPEGIGLAVYNRLIRAAGFEVIDLE